MDWNKIWDFGLQVIKSVGSGSDTYYADRVASVIVDSAQNAFALGEHSFAFQLLVAISEYYNDVKELTIAEHRKLKLKKLRC